MGVLDELRRELQNAIEEAARQSQQTRGRAPAAPEAVPELTRRGRDGRLQRQSLERSAQARSLIRSAEPTDADYARKVTQMEREEPAAINALPPAFDLDIPEVVANTAAVPARVSAVSPERFLQAFVLMEALSPPPSRRVQLGKTKRTGG